MCKIRQQFKRRSNIYGRLPPKNIEELKLWGAVHVELIGPYSKSISQQNPGGAIIKNNVILVCMTMIEPSKGWFKIVKVPTYGLDEVTGGNDDYIDKPSPRVIQLFNNTCISIYLHPCKVVFDN